MTSSPLPGGHLRVSDAERETAVGALAEHYTAGRLTLPELEDRAEQAYRATTRAELVALTADLPTPQRALQPSAPRPRRPAWATHPNAAWSGGWSAWWLTAAICLVIWLATSVAQGSVSYFWPGWVIGPWAGALLVSPCGARRTLPGPGRS